MRPFVGGILLKGIILEWCCCLTCAHFILFYLLIVYSFYSRSLLMSFRNLSPSREGSGFLQQSFFFLACSRHTIVYHKLLLHVYHMYDRLSDVKINKLGLLLPGSWAVPRAANPVQQPVSCLPVKSCILLTAVGNRGN